MIKIHKMNGSEIVLNCEHIENIESNPDTTITLMNGKKIITSNSADEIVKKVIQYKRNILLQNINN